MSRKLAVDAELKRYGKPRTDLDLHALNTFYEKSQATNGASLETVGKRLSGFIKRERPQTSDGYDWFWALYFHRGVGLMGLIAVLFPWATDANNEDGSKLDRSIAVYSKGCTKKQVKDLISELGVALFYYIPSKT